MIVCFFLMISFIGSLYSFDSTYHEVDFDLCLGNSQQADLVAQKNFDRAVAPGNEFERYVLRPVTSLQLFNFLKDLYNKHKLFFSESLKELRIPKIIHQIWLGDVFPEKYSAWRQSWIDHHPDWLYILWVDNSDNYRFGRMVTSLQELERLIECKIAGVVVIDVKQFDFRRKSLFDEAHNYGEKSDVLRYELLYRYGGLYVDTDFECFKPFDSLHHSFDFYTGCAPISIGTLKVYNGLIGARAGHDVLKECIEQGVSKNECARLDAVLFEGASISVATGPGLFTRAIFAAAGQSESRDTVMPSEYFYPARSTPHCFAMHYYECSWIPEVTKDFSWFVERVTVKLEKWKHSFFEYCSTVGHQVQQIFA